MADKGVAFTRKDPMIDPQAESELADLGLYSTPVTIIGDETVVGFDPEALARLLEN